MSRTQVKNGSRVWDALCNLTIVSGGGGINFASTTAVAKKAGVSKPTALKYLEMAREMGRARKEKITNNLVLWFVEEI